MGSTLKENIRNNCFKTLNFLWIIFYLDFFPQKVKYMPHVIITDITKEITKLYIHPIPVNEIKYWHNTTTGKWTI